MCVEVVGMTADEYASKELQQWRRQEAKKDIEAIKSHELDMIALGNTYVMKSHKGEQVIEKSEVADAAASSSETGPLLPEDAPVVRAKEAGPAEVTWAHPNHGSVTTEPLCDVCNGKLSLEDFVAAKLQREEDRKRRRHKSSKSSRRDKESSRHRYSLQIYTVV